ncbi:hypothetical protein LCGC14_0906140 [marine sediment metagenome]|uniref:Uncharacterized protein n=1 Tax=marine sediment metagenome TaxID=412755 RepID=A0A0F9S1Y2_9ZZZZ
MEFNKKSDIYNSFIISKYLDEEIEFLQRGKIKFDKFWKKQMVLVIRSRWKYIRNNGK